MKKGLPAKFLLIPGIVIFLALLVTFAPRFLPNESEYEKDQTRLAEVMKEKLPQQALPEIKYPIQGYRIPGIGGFCWLESAVGLIKYLEPDIDFDTFVFYGNPTLVMAGRNKNERWGLGLNQIHAFTQLGYTAFRGSTSPINLPQSVFPDIEERNLIYFKTPQEELDLMKKMISAKIIPTISYDGDFSTIIGYNKEGVWMVKSDPDQTDKEDRNFMTYPVAFNANFFTYDELFDKWQINYQFLWFEKTGPRRNENEVFAENKRNAEEATRNMKLVMEYLNKGGNLLDLTYAVDVPSSISLYRYFTKKGNIGLANQYLEIAKIYDYQRTSVGPNPIAAESKDRKFYLETLTKVQPLYEKAAAAWSSLPPNNL